jgi:hypothetical protein
VPVFKGGNYKLIGKMMLSGVYARGLYSGFFCKDRFPVSRFRGGVKPETGNRIKTKSRFSKIWDNYSLL